MSEQTLQALLAERIQTFAASDRPREIIDANVEKMFKDLAEDAFRSYGDMGKAVKEAFKAAMPANVGDMFELTRYNHLIGNALRERWLSSGIEGDMLRRANEAMDEVLAEGAVPAQVSLQALIDQFVDDNKEDAHNSGWERPEVRFESDGSFLHVYFDPEPESSHRSGGYSSRSERSVYSLKNAVHIHFHDKAKSEDGNRVGKVYSAKLDGDVIGKQLSIRNGWERLVAALYYGAATIVVDCDEDDFSYNLDD